MPISARSLVLRMAAALFALAALRVPAAASDYLYVWGMETRAPFTAMPPKESMGRDFLAVFDIRDGSPALGALVAMLPVGSRGRMAHHTNHDMPANGRLFASDYDLGEGYVFDLKDPRAPKLAAGFSAAGP